MDNCQQRSQLQRIGQGFCGTVWATSDGSPLLPSDFSRSHLVIKREDGGPGRSISHEWNMQQLVNNKAEQRTPESANISIPKAVAFLHPGSFDWKELLPRLPADYRACNSMISERIQPISPQGRVTLIERYCPSEAMFQVLSDDRSEACLIRPYPGKRRLHGPSERRGRKPFFSLRNFPLHVDQIEQHSLPTSYYATVMAKTLAFLHWECRVDGNDVEFVLASPRENAPEIIHTAAMGSHSLWMLDFDCCRTLDMENLDAAVDQIARAFWRNDPYYPRPGSSNAQDQQLWTTFPDQYKESGVRILSSRAEGNELAQTTAMMERVVKRIIETRGLFAKNASAAQAA